MEQDWSTPLDEALIGTKDMLILIRGEDEAQQLQFIFNRLGIIKDGLDVLDAWDCLTGDIAYRVDAYDCEFGYARPGYYDFESAYDDYLRFTFAPCVELDDIDVPDSSICLFE